MMVNFEIRRFPAAAVLTYDAPYRPDFKSASDALRKLCAAYNLNLDLSVLEAGEWCIGEERKRQIQSEGLWNGMFV
jgi:predicted ATP-grasp superfamily ATP-dependent carboligase